MDPTNQGKIFFCHLSLLCKFFSLCNSELEAGLQIIHLLPNARFILFKLAFWPTREVLVVGIVAVVDSLMLLFLLLLLLLLLLESCLHESLKLIVEFVLLFIALFLLHIELVLLIRSLLQAHDLFDHECKTLIKFVCARSKLVKLPFQSSDARILIKQLLVELGICKSHCIIRGCHLLVRNLFTCYCC